MSFTSFIFGLAIGFFAGWIAVRRPQWATDFIVWLKQKIGLA